ncbi:MAG: alanine racemase, partial [Rhodocyclaceae bacterium]
MPRPIRATINLAALRDNYLLAQRRAAGARAWAVVKANAYGHGLLHAASALSKAADGFALLDLADAVALRDAGARQPILLLEGVFEIADLPVCAEYGLTPVIHCVEQIQMLRSVALPSRLPVYLKLNSGMNRLGITPAQLPAARYALKDSRSVGEVTLMTHFAEADGGRGIAEQYARFVQMSTGWSCPASLANSAALLRHPQTARDWARPGIMLYGGSPFADESAASLGLRPVMTLESRIIGVQ